MAAVVSTRILRLQAISPRVSSSIMPASVAAVSLASTQGSSAPPGSVQVTVYWNAATSSFEIWKDSEFKVVPTGTIIYTITVPNLSLNTLVPGVSAATGNVLVGPYTAMPPNLSLNTLVPGVSVTATSP